MYRNVLNLNTFNVTHLIFKKEEKKIKNVNKSKYYFLFQTDFLDLK